MFFGTHSFLLQGPQSAWVPLGREGSLGMRYVPGDLYTEMGTERHQTWSNPLGSKASTTWRMRGGQAGAACPSPMSRGPILPDFTGCPAPLHACPRATLAEDGECLPGRCLPGWLGGIRPLCIFNDSNFPWRRRMGGRPLLTSAVHLVWGRVESTLNSLPPL